MATWLNTTTAPWLITAAVAGGFNAGSSVTGGNVWAYRTTDTLSTIVGATQYFTDGFRRGIRPYDAIIVLDTNTPKASWVYVTAVSSVSTGGATVLAFST